MGFLLHVYFSENHISAIAAMEVSRRPNASSLAMGTDQETAITALLPHDTGVLAPTTAFGKTILAIRMMAEHGRQHLESEHS